MSEKGNIKSLIVGSIITLIVTLIGAYYAFYLSRSTVDLKYTLSERIVINAQGESVQQLEIKNLGNTSAEKIVINLIGDIKIHSITKNVENDKVQEFSTSDGIQIVYPDLPPQSSIKIALTSIGRDGCMVSVSHGKGIAKEALSSSSSGGIYLIINVLIFSMFIYYIWINTNNTLISIWSNRAISNYNLDKVLKRSSPPVLIKKNWKDIRKLALQHALLEIIEEADESVFSVTSKKCFKFLDEKLYTNCVFSTDEKMKLVETAQELAKLFIHIKCDKIYDASEFVDLLKLEKPKLFHKDKWSNIREEVIASYLQKISREDLMLSKIYKIDDCVTTKVLSNKLDFLDDEEHGEFIKNVKENFLRKLKQQINNLVFYDKEDIEALCQTPIPSFILQYEWDEVILVARQKFALLYLQELLTWNIGKEDCEKIFALDIPQNLQGNEWSKFMVLLEKYYSIFAFEIFFESFSKEKIIKDFQPNHIHNIDVMQKMFTKIENSCYIQKMILSKPEDLTHIVKPESISMQLADSIEKYIKEKELLSNELEHARKEFIHFTNLKEKVLAQLELINNILEAPLSIERIEDYEDIFSKGNYENLKKVSKILNSNGYDN